MTGTGAGTSGTPGTCWNGRVTLKVEPVHGLGGTAARGIKRRQCVSKVMKKHHFILRACVRLFLSAKEGKRNMILAATGNRCQFDIVEQAMKIQVPNDEIRNHDDCIGKQHNNIFGGAVNEDNYLLSENEQGHRGGSGRAGHGLGSRSRNSG